MPHKPKGSPLPDMPHLIIQTAEFWRACGEKQRAAFLATGACTAENSVGFMLALLLQCALSPILISRGASWRGSRTAVQLAARRLFISSASPLSVCLPACLPVSATNSQMQKDRLSEHLDSVERVLLFYFSPGLFLMPDLTLFLDSCICKHLCLCRCVSVGCAGASVFMCAPRVGAKRILFVSSL